MILRNHTYHIPSLYNQVSGHLVTNCNLQMPQLDQYKTYVYTIRLISPSTIIFTCDKMCTYTIHVERNIHIYIVLTKYSVRPIIM